MLAKTYQEQTQKFAIYPKEEWLPYLILGLAAEAGEVAGKLAKFYRKDDGSAESSEKLKADVDLEMGDCIWMISQWCNETGTTLGAIMEMNIAKLKSRKSRGTIKGNGDNR